MVIVAVDPNKKDLKLLVKYLHLAFPGCEVVMFSDPEAAAEYIRETPIDVLYTEAAMLGMTGFALQKAAEAVQPAVLPVFVTDSAAYAGKAIQPRAKDYSLKPVTKQAVWESMSDTRFAYVPPAPKQWRHAL